MAEIIWQLLRLRNKHHKKFWKVFLPPESTLSSTLKLSGRRKNACSCCNNHVCQSFHCILKLTNLSLIHQDNENATLKRFTKLLEAEQSAQVHATALNAVKKELDQIQLACTTSHQPSDIQEHFNTARHVMKLNDKSQQKLQDLTADMGLLDLELPQQMTNTDREYLKKYTFAQAQQ